ncbi:MAG TPA: BON domain-containing protein [Bryobacteraceae bacterium]|nr:BON domain-containing protein [Bryobacteraceae bacterium]
MADHWRYAPAGPVGIQGGVGGSLAAWGQQRIRHRSQAGRGPRNYTRSDARICEDICERLTRDPDLDATDIEVSVRAGEVTLGGIAHTRAEKRHAEDDSWEVWGVRNVFNHIRLRPREVENPSGDWAPALGDVRRR